jgi:hypothetical protein
MSKVKISSGYLDLGDTQPGEKESDYTGWLLLAA